MEPILHFVLPFASLILAGVDTRKAFVLGVISVLPDIDIIFGVHRSMTHSIIFWIILTAPLYLHYKKNNPDHVKDPLLVLMSGGCHILLDLSSATPVFWPLMTNNVSVDFALFLQNMNLGSYFQGFQATVISSEAFITSLMLLIPIYIQKKSKPKTYPNKPINPNTSNLHPPIMHEHTIETSQEPQIIYQAYIDENPQNTIT